MLKVRGAGVATMLKGGDAGPVTFDVDSAVKDLRTMLAEGKARGVELPLVETTLACYEETKRKRLGRGGDIRRVGLLGRTAPSSDPRSPEPRTSSSADQSGATCPSSRLRKPPPSSTPRSRRGARTNCAPLTVAVLDAGGHLVAFKREDKSGLLRFDIAFGKAWGALGMGFGSRTLAARAAKTPQFFTMLAAASGGRMVTNPGGVLIRTPRGDIVGAVGISGDTSDRDEACAVAGIEAAGLKADPGQDAN